MNDRDYLFNMDNAIRYVADLQFTPPLAPNEAFKQNAGFVTLLKAIESRSCDKSDALGEDCEPDDEELVSAEFPGIAVPLYVWEAHPNDGTVQTLYIGQTIRMKIGERFEYHPKLVKLLCDHVNDPDTKVYVRLCVYFYVDIYEALDLRWGRPSIEDLRPDDAEEIVNEVEAHLIYDYQPIYNEDHKKKPRKPWKPFKVVTSSVLPQREERADPAGR